MKKLLKGFLLLWLAISLISTSIAFGQQYKNLVESWEKRHNALQPPEKIMDAIGLKQGTVIGDIGAGGGRFTVWFSIRVGENGKVYANDIDKKALAHLEQRCKRHGFKNVIPCLGKVVDPNIPKGALDIAFMINVYHHLDNKIGLLKNIIPTLKPDGILVIVENEPKKSGWKSHTTSKAVLIREAGKAGYELIKVETFLSEDNIYFFRPKGENDLK